MAQSGLSANGSDNSIVAGTSPATMKTKPLMKQYVYFTTQLLPLHCGKSTCTQSSVSGGPRSMDVAGVNRP
jgi:hypothetical protein